MNEELTDAQCDKLVEDVFNKVAATYDSKYGNMNPKDLNPDIREHDSLRRAIVREAYALGMKQGEQELTDLSERLVAARETENQKEWVAAINAICRLALKKQS